MNTSTTASAVTRPVVTLQQQDDSGCQLQLLIPAELFYFQGHFDQQAILAGVVQLDWAIQYARQYLPFSQLQVKTIEVLKYQQLILPNMTVTLTLHKKDQHTFTFSYTSASGSHSSGRVKVA